MGTALRTVGILPWLLLISGAPGCYDSHGLGEPGPGVDASVSDVGLRDAALLEDGAVVDSGFSDASSIDAGFVDASVRDSSVVTRDVGVTNCYLDFVVTSISIPTLASGVGFDLDGGGTQVGCGVDGVNGVDNGLAGLVAYADTAGVDLDQLILAATTLRRVRVHFRLNLCRAVPSLAAVGENGRILGSSRPVDIEHHANGSFSFRGTTALVPIPFAFRGFAPDFSLDEAQITGTITGSTLSRVVIGGTLPRERVVALAEQLAGISMVPQDSIEDALLDLLDLHVDSSGGTCTALSAAFQGAGITFVR